MNRRNLMLALAAVALGRSFAAEGGDVAIVVRPDVPVDNYPSPSFAA